MKTYTKQEIDFLVKLKNELSYNSLNSINNSVNALFDNYKINKDSVLGKLYVKIIDFSTNHIFYNSLLKKDCVYIGHIENCQIPFNNFIKDNKLNEVLENASMTLGDRMKSYEKDYQIYLDKTKPVIIRLDGRSFSKWTKQFKSPFDDNFIDMMNKATIELCKEISGFKLAFCQSDEITILFDAFSNENSELWFGGRTDKILSVCAGVFSSNLTKEYIKFLNQTKLDDLKMPSMDCRVFQVSDTEEIKNAFLFRQRDCEKNAISMYAESMFSHKQLLNKNGTEKIQMMSDVNFDYENSNSLYKFGRFISKHQINKGTKEKHIIRTEFKIESFKISEEKEKFNLFFK